MRFAALPFLMVFVACTATDEAELDTDGLETGNEAASTGITTTGPVTTAEGGGSGDPPPPGTSCEACVSGWCGDELQACLADDGCSCWLGCTDEMTDEQCSALCGAPGAQLVELYQCAVMLCAQACASEETTGADEDETGSESESGDEEGTTGTGTDDTGSDASTGGEAESTETTQ